MKRMALIFMIAAAALSSSCSTHYTIEDIVAEKVKIDKTDNPAKKFIIKNNLQTEGFFVKNVIELKNVLVKDIIPSTNIDYEFCILSDIDTTRGKVECYIYTSNVGRIAKLEKGKSRIDVEGQFGRFFTLLDEYYTKLELVKSRIVIHRN
ncbi:MAG: hypothetical protein JXA20_14075 [Spirochaetes bacterium]|nr:hypothetical protein [Spirochaetota bacterium]